MGSPNWHFKRDPFMLRDRNLLLVGAARALVNAHICHRSHKVDPVDLPYYSALRFLLYYHSLVNHKVDVWQIRQPKKQCHLILQTFLEFPQVEHGHSSRTFRCSSSLLS